MFIGHTRNNILKKNEHIWNVDAKADEGQNYERW